MEIVKLSLDFTMNCKIPLQIFPLGKFTYYFNQVFHVLVSHARQKLVFLKLNNLYHLVRALFIIDLTSRVFER